VWCLWRRQFPLQSGERNIFKSTKETRSVHLVCFVLGNSRYFCSFSSVSWKVPEQSQIIYSITNSNKLSGLCFEMCLESENKTFVQQSVKSANTRACACVGEGSMLESCGLTCAAAVTQLLRPSHWGAAVIRHHHSLSDRSLLVSLCGCIWHSKPILV